MTARATVTTAIKTRLDAANITGLQVEPRWPKQLTPPLQGCVLVVDCTDIEYGLVFGGTDRSRLTVQLHLFVSMAGGLDNADSLLDPFISNTGGASILQAIRADAYLGSTVKYALPPTGVSEIGVRHFGPDDAGFDLYGATIAMLVEVE